MKLASTILFFALSLALALLVTACGSSTSSSTGSGGGGRYGYGGRSNATPTSTTSSTSVMVIKTTTLTVGGKSLTVLTNAQGMTLYYRTSDTPASVCSGSCASAWPPVLSTIMPGASSALPGTFSLMNDANGSQVAYNGHPLYTYSGDAAAGQVNGQGFGNVWFVASTNLPAATTPSGSIPTPGGYYRQP
jgi:predicted lipoprotein with Yx(FWY)xxD motif